MSTDYFFNIDYLNNMWFKLWLNIENSIKFMFTAVFQVVWDICKYIPAFGSNTIDFSGPNGSKEMDFQAICQKYMFLVPVYSWTW